MAITPREVKNKRDSNGILTGKPGIVYDVNIKYVDATGKRKTYAKRGFPTKRAATLFEAEKRIELATPTYVTSTAAQGKMRLSEFLPEWLESHRGNIRPKTYNGYRTNVYHHIIPTLGNLRLNQLSPQHIDKLLSEMDADGKSQNTIRFCQRTLSVALTHACKYGYIKDNPTKNITYKFRRDEKIDPPYNIEQIQRLLMHTTGTDWQMLIVLGGLYGLRLGEVLGLKWRDIDVENGQLWIIDQLPQLPKDTTIVTNYDPLKDRGPGDGRLLPLTNITQEYFVTQKNKQQKQKQLCAASCTPYYDNDLVIAKPDGRPYRKDSVSRDYPNMLKKAEMPQNTFHGLRRSAASNMHTLTGDYYTISQILGHTIDGMSREIHIPHAIASVTSRYIDVRMERKKEVLEAYHNAVLAPQATEKINEQTE